MRVRSDARDLQSRHVTSGGVCNPLTGLTLTPTGPALAVVV